jgi:hypothetical protein
MNGYVCLILKRVIHVTAFRICTEKGEFMVKRLARTRFGNEVPQHLCALLRGPSLHLFDDLSCAHTLYLNAPRPSRKGMFMAANRGRAVCAFLGSRLTLPPCWSRSLRQPSATVTICQPGKTAGRHRPACHRARRCPRSRRPAAGFATGGRPASPCIPRHRPCPGPWGRTC